jgi:hypothetical protein
MNLILFLIEGVSLRSMAESDNHGHFTASSPKGKASPATIPALLYSYRL